MALNYKTPAEVCFVDQLNEKINHLHQLQSRISSLINIQCVRGRTPEKRKSFLEEQVYSFFLSGCLSQHQSSLFGLKTRSIKPSPNCALPTPSLCLILSS